MGSIDAEVENVPMINNGKLKPIPNANNNANPINRFPIVATMLKTSASPGETHGDAIVPLTAPKTNADNNELLNLVSV